MDLLLGGLAKKCNSRALLYHCQQAGFLPMFRMPLSCKVQMVGEGRKELFMWVP
jgi:hypothetical protein